MDFGRMLASSLPSSDFLNQEVQELFIAVLRTAGPFFFMGMQVSSLKTALMIARLKSVGDLSPIPFLSLVLNGFVWLMYGSLKSDWTICIPNFTAVIVGTFCSSLYHKNSKKEVSMVLYMVVVSIIIPSIYLGATSSLKGLGFIGIFMSILLMGSPLSTVATVIKQKNTDSMPFATSVTTFLNSLAWTMYGYLVANDLMLWVPSFIGLILAIFQLILFALYGLPVPTVSTIEAPAQAFVSINIEVYLYSKLYIFRSLSVHI